MRFGTAFRPLVSTKFISSDTVMARSEELELLKVSENASVAWAGASGTISSEEWLRNLWMRMGTVAETASSRRLIIGGGEGLVFSRTFGSTGIDLDGTIGSSSPKGVSASRRLADRVEGKERRDIVRT